MTNYPNESEARRDIIEVGRRLYMRGLVCANDGNISARVSEQEIVITPSGVSKGFMTDGMLLKLDLNGRVLSGAGKPSSESEMHLEIYKSSPDICAVCHAHPPVAATFAAAGVPLDRAFLQETVMLLGVIPVVPYAQPGSGDLARNTAGFAREYHGALLEHHGAVSWGNSVIESLFRMESIEYTATVTMHSGAMGFSRTMSAERIADLISARTKWGITKKLGKFK